MYFAKHPNDVLNVKNYSYAVNAQEALWRTSDQAVLAAAAAIRTGGQVANIRLTGAVAAIAYDSAYQAIGAAAEAVGRSDAFFDSLSRDTNSLNEGMNFKTLLEMPLWHSTPMASPQRLDRWSSLKELLLTEDNYWPVWIDWYDGILNGDSNDKRDAVFFYVPGALPWDADIKAINFEIMRRLGNELDDPAPIENIDSAITIDRLPDGRIGVQPGPFSLPALLEPLKPEEHRNALIACRTWATGLKETATSPQFQGRAEYAEILTDYLLWLPEDLGTGNILLADGEARTLNKLFTADQDILPPAFASKLSVLLEDHIAARSFYPEIERHYQAVNTGRLSKPLPRDAVEENHRRPNSESV